MNRRLYHSKLTNCHHRWNCCCQYECSIHRLFQPFDTSSVYIVCLISFFSVIFLFVCWPIPLNKNFISFNGDNCPQFMIGECNRLSVDSEHLIQFIWLTTDSCKKVNIGLFLLKNDLDLANRKIGSEAVKHYRYVTEYQFGISFSNSFHQMKIIK